MKKSELIKLIREEIQKLSEDKYPDTFISKTKNGYTLIHKGIPVMSSNRTMNDVMKMAKQMKLTIGPKMWDNGKWKDLPK